MKIVVVEDEEKVQNKIRKILKDFSFENNCDLDVCYYKRYDKSLQNEIDDLVQRKVYILDIELDNSISGLDIAKIIRENDWDSEIIFTTSHDNMFESIHRNLLEVIDFIEKFQNFEERLKHVLKVIYKRKYDRRTLKLSGRNVNLELNMKQILYITRDKEDRKVIIHTSKEVGFKVNLTLAEILEMLDDRFVQTHKSCIANKDKIVLKNYSQGYFELINGERVELLSKTYKKEIEQC